MSDGSFRIARTDDLAAVRRLGVACGLDDSGRGDEAIEAAWGAFDGERLVGAIVLERNHGLETVNWMAVDALPGAAGSPAGCMPRWSAKRWPAASLASG